MTPCRVNATRPNILHSRNAFRHAGFKQFVLIIPGRLSSETTGSHRDIDSLKYFLYVGTRALVEAGYPAKLVEKAVQEAPELQPLAIQVLSSYSSLLVKFQEICNSCTNSGVRSSSSAFLAH